MAGALAKKLGAREEVRLFLPRYHGIDPASLTGPHYRLSIPLGREALPVVLRSARASWGTAYFIDYPPLFDREGLYGPAGSDYADNERRFIVYCRSVMEGAKAVGFKPDVLHAHDWQTGLIPAYLKRHYRDDPAFAGAASLMTVHNMAYQGAFPRESLELAGFDGRDFTPEQFEYFGRFSFLKAGLVCADVLSTVSPTYAREIQESSERGFGLEGVLRHRSADLHGVLNGIDLDYWNPETDKALARSYTARDYEQGKAACKADLQNRCGLERAAGVPLVGIVSRFDRQKGLDLAAPILRERLGRCQLAVLGAGEPGIAASFADIARARPRSAYLHTGYDEDFAHRLYAAADIFLMPSRFEPCGLGQMIAMRYGCVPVVSRTGGLADTVFEEGRANGFVAEPGDAAGLGAALDRALGAYGRPAWRARAAMEQDFSWERSIGVYLDLYRKARAKLAGVS